MLDLKIELYRPTPIQQRIEKTVSNELGVIVDIRGEESVLSLQAHLAQMEKSSPSVSLGKDPDLVEKIETMESMLNINGYVRSGMTAGGIWDITEKDSEAELTKLVNGVVRNKKERPSPVLPGILDLRTNLRTNILRSSSIRLKHLEK